MNQGSVSKSFKQSKDDDRSMPSDSTLEKRIISIILSNEADAVVIMSKITKSDFFCYPEHQYIYKAILKSFESQKAIHLFSIIDILRANGQLEYVGGENYLFELNKESGSSLYIEDLCDALINLYLLRKMITTCSDAIENCYSTEIQEVQSTFSNIESNIFSIRDFKVDNWGLLKTSSNTNNIVDNTIDYLDKLGSKTEIEKISIKTGLPDLDNIIVGMRNQELIVVAARPSVGKTALALNIATNIATRHDENRKKVAFFSLEMSAEQLVSRMIYSLSRVTERNLVYEKDKSIKEEDWSRVTSTGDELKKIDFFVDPTPNISINELKAKATRLKAIDKIDIIFVDYLQLMHAEVARNDNRQVEVAAISAGLKHLAKELNIPVFVTAQLNRQAEQEEPKLSHLRESGAIEQDADVVMLLNRDRVNEKNYDSDSTEAELVIEKNRNGRVGIVKLLFFPQITTFECQAKGEIY